VFASRRVSQLVSHPVNPRIYKRTTKHADVGFDISLLLDMSASMGRLSDGLNRSRGLPAFQYFPGEGTLSDSFTVLSVLASALDAIPDINLEILGYTADILILPDGTSPRWSSSSSGANIIYEIKPFAATDTPARLKRFAACTEAVALFGTTFDIGGIKVASSRLCNLPSGNRKLLIVLSDGQPCSSQCDSIELTRQCVAEVESRLNVVGIGLASHSVERIYKQHIVIPRAQLASNNLMQIVINRVRDFVLKGK
jgi:cobalamin biosynthesis protein CobT